MVGAELSRVQRSCRYGLVLLNARGAGGEAALRVRDGLMLFRYRELV